VTHLLHAEALRPTLRIHDLSREVLDWLKDQEEATPRRFIDFLVEKGAARYEMSRYFLASLMITNTGHIAVVDDGHQHEINSMLIMLRDGDRPIGDFAGMM